MTDSIVKKTLITTGVLVGACVVFVGLLTAVTLTVASHAVGASADAGASESPATPGPSTPGAQPATGKLPRGTKPPSAT